MKLSQIIKKTTLNKLCSSWSALNLSIYREDTLYNICDARDCVHDAFYSNNNISDCDFTLNQNKNLGIKSMANITKSQNKHRYTLRERAAMHSYLK